MMEPQFWVAVLSRWIHVGTAIVLIGGSVYQRLVLLPAAATLPDAEHQALRRSVMDRWRRILHVGIALFLLSGLYNYWVALQNHKGDSLYHAMIGTKILLALGVFALAEMLAGRSPSAERRRANARTWLAVTITLAAIIVAISGYLKIRGIPPNLPEKDAGAPGASLSSQV